MSDPINERLTLFIFADLPRWNDDKQSYTPLVLIVNDKAQVQNPQSWDRADQLVGFAKEEQQYAIELTARDAIEEPKKAVGLMPVLTIDGGFSTIPVQVTGAEQIHKPED